MEDVKKIKCKKCGSINIYGAKVCHKCKAKLENLKSCPKCAKRNSLEAKVCSSCGFRFSKQKSAKKSFFINLSISILLMVVMVLLVVFNKSGVVTDISKVLKVLAGALVLALLFSNFNYNSKDKINYTAESEMMEKNPVTNRMKIISNIVIVIGGLVVLGVCIYFYFKS